MSEVTIEWGDSYLPLATGHIRDRFVLLEGPRGTSKTTGILSILLMRALRYPGSTWLLARSTRTRLTDTVLVTL
jgi:phage terminase large subunit